jgi:hypothetical protein
VVGEDGSAAEQILGAAVQSGVAQLGHGPRFDLAYPLSGEVEVGADIVEGAGLAAVESETQPKDLALALVEHEEHLRHLVS